MVTLEQQQMPKVKFIIHKIQLQQLLRKQHYMRLTFTLITKRKAFMLTIILRQIIHKEIQQVVNIILLRVDTQQHMVIEVMKPLIDNIIMILRLKQL